MISRSMPPSICSRHRLWTGSENAANVLAESSKRISLASDRSDIQGQFHHSISVIVANEDTGLASQMQERAKRIWSTQGIVSVQFRNR